MFLHQKINEDLKMAMKAANGFELGVLRMLSAAFHNKEIEKKGRGLEPVLSDEEVIEVLSKEAKKRKEAIEIFNKGNRSDLAEKEAKELEIIKKYLPEEMAVEEVEKIVKAAIEKIRSANPPSGGEKEFGLVMKEAMKDLKGKADASSVSEIIKKSLNNRSDDE
jgi:uncharacterized protein YqeY